MIIPSAAITKLPQDLVSVQHILPFWFNYIYYFLWTLGIVSIFMLCVYLFIRTLRYINSIKSDTTPQKIRIREFTSAQLTQELQKILGTCEAQGIYRTGCHQIAAVLRMYYEIQLKIDIEEMTINEIRKILKDKIGLGDYLDEIGKFQFGSLNPSRSDFLEQYNKAIDLIQGRRTKP